MADDSVVDDGDESQLVTVFLLNTCRLLQPTRHHVCSTMICAGMAANVQVDDRILIPLVSGSVAEFYIQPMLSCVDDIDIMYHSNTELAIPDGYPPPSQLPAEFHICVMVYEIIDSGYPGFVYLMRSYLLEENTDADKYNADKYVRRQCVEYDNSPGMKFESHGPASTVPSTVSKLGFSVDDVICIRCLSWPTQAND